MASNLRQQSGLDRLRPYVPGKPVEEVQREYGLTDVIKLASNENPLGPSPAVVAALHEALDDLHYYPDAQAYRLTHALGARYGFPADWIRVGNGADGIIRELCVSYVDEGDEVIVSKSSFPVYDICINVMRGIVIKTPLKGLNLDLKAMADAVTPRTRLIFVCNPNNPTGTAVGAAEVEALMASVPEHVLVVFDEAYFEFADNADYPDTLAYVGAGRNTIVLRTFSKAYGIAGIRLGFGVARPDILAPLRASMESFPVNRLAQVAGEAALDDCAFLEKTVRLNAMGRHYLQCKFERLGLAYAPSQTNFVMVHIGPQASDVFQRLLRTGVIVRPCGGYDLPEYLRVTIGTPEQNERFVRSLEQILGVTGK